MSTQFILIIILIIAIVGACFATIASMLGYVKTRVIDYLLTALLTLILVLIYVPSAIAAEEYSLTTLGSSYHFDRNDFNEIHEGIFISRNNWSVGTYTNSINKESWAINYQHDLTPWASLSAGVATGYEYPLIPTVGLNLHTRYVYLEITPILVFTGLRLPIGEWL
jgi:hypothetical protein